MMVDKALNLVEAHAAELIIRKVKFKWRVILFSCTPEKSSVIYTTRDMITWPCMFVCQSNVADLCVNARDADSFFVKKPCCACNDGSCIK